MMSEVNLPSTPDRGRCMACDEPLGGAFCSHCGQPADSPRFTWSYLLRELIIRFTFEKGFPLTVRELVLRPGQFIRGYISGKRKGYSSPFAFFFIITAIAVVVSSYFFGSTEEMLDVPKMRESFKILSDRQMDAYVHLSDGLASNTSISMLGLVIPFAIVLWLCFIGTGINLVECTIFSLYSFAFACMIWIFTLPLALIIPKFTAAVVLMLLVYPATIVYAGHGFFGGSWWNYFKLFFSFVFSYCLFSIVVGVGMLAIILVFY